MRILFLIGNGFDLNVGLNTSFNDFLDYYLEESIPENVDPVGQRYIIRLKEDIKNNIDLWSNFEMEYGKHMSKLGKMGSHVHSLQEELDIINDDIRDKLSTYIAKEDEHSYFAESALNVFLTDIIKPEKYLRDFEISDINNRRLNYWTNSSNVVDFITFNYTNTIEHLLNEKKILFSGFEVHEPIHIHGYYNERMILGVNDASQINNEDLSKLVYANDTLVKSECNHTYGDSHTNKAKNLIKDAQLICCYGLSFGDTDKLWWIKVCESLKNKTDLIVILFFYSSSFFDYSNSGPKLQNEMRKIKDIFLSKSEIEEPMRSNLARRIYVSINAPIFNFKIDNKNH